MSMIAITHLRMSRHSYPLWQKCSAHNEVRHMDIVMQCKMETTRAFETNLIVDSTAPQYCFAEVMI